MGRMIASALSPGASRPWAAGPDHEAPMIKRVPTTNQASISHSAAFSAIDSNIFRAAPVGAGQVALGCRSMNRMEPKTL